MGGQRAVRSLLPSLFTRHAAAIVASHCASPDRSAKNLRPHPPSPLTGVVVLGAEQPVDYPGGKSGGRTDGRTFGSPLGQALGRLAQPDSGLARLVVEIASREITISRDRISDRLVSA